MKKRILISRLKSFVLFPRSNVLSSHFSLFQKMPTYSFSESNFTSTIPSQESENTSFSDSILKMTNVRDVLNHYNEKQTSLKRSDVFLVLKFVARMLKADSVDLNLKNDPIFLSINEYILQNLDFMTPTGFFFLLYL
jgi:hypothetical protein